VGIVKKLSVPIVILQGKYDYQTVSSVTRVFFDRLQAPNKKYVQFNNAAHLLPFEQPTLFNRTLIAETSRLMATVPACARGN
jgi:pimeloyl-ACP methyl ester carboxylesterase